MLATDVAGLLNIAYGAGACNVIAVDWVLDVSSGVLVQQRTHIPQHQTR